MTEPGGGRAGVVDPPAERTSFVGRRQELGDVRRLLGEARLVTLVGPGGVGKTRLAARAAADVRRTFPDGVAWADLGPVRDPALVATRVAAATGVRDLSDRWPVGAVAEVVADRRLLLVLDGCEHLRDPCAVVVDTLLDACPQLRVLAVSRRSLDVAGETVLGVQPLTEADAVRLLVDRARAAGPAVDPEDDPAVLAELCRRLDGLPLAIELAAVRLRTLGPADLLDRLEDRFRLLRSPGVVGQQRHRTLRATMEWSRDLLPEAERLLWRRAAVFVRDFDLGAAEAVCGHGDLEPADVLDAVDGLVAHSLLETVPGAPGARYRMLDSVRAFGRELLDASGETSGVRERHRRWCADLVAQASADFLRPGQVAAFDRLAAHHAELGAALDACLADPELVDDGLAMAADLWLYWEARGHLGEGRRWLEALLGAAPASEPSRSRALAVSGYLALAAFDPGTARPFLTEARVLAAASGQPRVEAFTTQYLGQAALFAGDLVAADALLREAVARYAALDDRYAAFCLADLGVTALLAGEVSAASEAFEDSLRRNEGGDPWTRSHALWGLGLVRLRQHDTPAACRYEEEALRLMRVVDDPSGVALCVDALAWVAAAEGDGDRAARLTGAAAAVWRSIPAEPPAPLAGFRHDYLDDLRRGLGRRFETLADDGRALPRVAAVAVALGETTDLVGPPPGPAAVLTPRQREVAGLVAEGLTDREIAARLVISPRTAESHVEQILTRLGFRSRVEIAAWAAAHGPNPYERQSGTP